MPRKDSMQVQDATLADVDAIYAFSVHPGFQVNEDIKFYDLAELEQWIADPATNIVLVIKTEKGIAGFAYCKLLSYCWALLDGFFIEPEMRQHGCGKMLLNTLVARLRERNIEYLSTLADAKESELHKALEHFAFRRQKTYVWYDMCI
jgi:GNAT superfamily N-acetyltransferase